MASLALIPAMTALEVATFACPFASADFAPARNSWALVR